MPLTAGILHVMMTKVFSLSYNSIYEIIICIYAKHTEKEF